MELLKAFTKEQLKTEVPVLNVGDTVKVHNKIKEGTRERIQIFEGTIIAKHGGGISETFTVHSPNVDKVEIVRVGKVRRAKLFYLRDRVGKSAKVKERI